MIIANPPERPKKRKISSKWENIVDTLKNRHPGEWGLIGTFSRGVPTHIRKGRYRSFYPEGEESPIDYMSAHWTVHADHLPDGNCDVYVKWEGEGCVCVSCK
jgi:hypothetical protein